MAENTEQKLKAALENEQKHFESMVSNSEIDALKSKVLQKIDSRLAENRTEPPMKRAPTWFAMAATVVLSVSILLYTQFTPTELILLDQTDINKETTFISTLSQDEIMALTAVPMSSDFDAPIIKLVQPKDLENIQTPLTVEFLFEFTADAEINPDSFKLTYGLLAIDITKRFLNKMNIESNRLTVSNVIIPAGKHRLTVHIADSRGRTSKAQFNFSVN